MLSPLRGVFGLDEQLPVHLVPAKVVQDGLHQLGFLDILGIGRKNTGNLRRLDHRHHNVDVILNEHVSQPDSAICRAFPGKRLLSYPFFVLSSIFGLTSPGRETYIIQRGESVGIPSKSGK